MSQYRQQNIFYSLITFHPTTCTVIDTFEPLLVASDSPLTTTRVDGSVCRTRRLIKHISHLAVVIVHTNYILSSELVAYTKPSVSH